MRCMYVCKDSAAPAHTRIHAHTVSQHVTYERMMITICDNSIPLPTPPPPELEPSLSLAWGAAGLSSQTINYQRSLQSHTRARARRRSHISALPQRAANPASQSDAGLGGCDGVAAAPSTSIALCTTHSFSAPFTMACNATVGQNTSSGACSSVRGCTPARVCVRLSCRIPNTIYLHKRTYIGLGFDG